MRRVQFSGSLILALLLNCDSLFRYLILADCFIVGHFEFVERVDYGRLFRVKPFNVCGLAVDCLLDVLFGGWVWFCGGIVGLMMFPGRGPCERKPLANEICKISRY